MCVKEDGFIKRDIGTGKIFIDKIIDNCYNKIVKYYIKKRVWNFMDEIMISVICLCYNHEPYIKDALDGFLKQKTTFPFEVLVHDDASTDKSAEIIREYEAKYPDIIKPIYQTENQHSKGLKITQTFVLPKVRGKYIAFCEGDDFWTDENKLQKQVDFLEANPEYTVCTHNSILCDLKKNEETVWFPTEDREITAENAILSRQTYHLSSIMVKTDFYLKRPAWTRSIPGVGDHPNVIYFTLSGRVMYLGDVMSCYRFGTLGSWTARILRNYRNRIPYYQSVIQMHRKADKYYDYQYHKVFRKAILLAKARLMKTVILYCLSQCSKCCVAMGRWFKQSVAKRRK